MSNVEHRKQAGGTAMTADRQLLADWLCDLACVVGWHNWWDAGGGQHVCLDCGRTISARRIPVP